MSDKKTAGDRRIDMRTWFNPRHISALDLATEQGGQYQTTTVTIEEIIPPSEVQCGPKKEMLAQAKFKGKKKKMLLRESHMKTLIRMFGYNVQKMSGKRVELWVEPHVKAFGMDIDCIRFRAASGNGRSLLPGPTSAHKSTPDNDLQTEADDADQQLLEEMAADSEASTQEAREYFEEPEQLESGQ